MYSSNDIQKALELLKENKEYLDKFREELVSYCTSSSDLSAILHVIYEGYYEEFDRYDSDVCEQFLTVSEKVFGKDWNVHGIKVQKAVKYLEIPKICPKCGHPTKVRTSEKGVKTLWCDNPNCGQSKNQSLTHFVSRDAMNIDGLSEGILDTLMSVGAVSTMADILKLEDWEDELYMLDGFGEKKIKKLLNAIEKAKEVKLENFIYALGIPNVGLQTAKLIAKHCGYELDTFREMNWAELYNNIDGIGDTIATNVDEWLSDEDNQAEIDDMLEHGLTIVGSDRVVTNALAGKVFCCTGAVYQFSSRTELKNYIESQGGKLTGSVSNNTNYLITNDTTSGSTKNRTAAALGIPVITEAEFIERFGGK